MKKYFKRYTRESLAAGFYIFLNIILSISASVLLMSLINVIAERNMQRVIWILVINLSVWVLNIESMRLKKVYLAKAIAKMNNAVRADITNILGSKTYSQYAEGKTGEYLSWYTESIAQIESKGFAKAFELAGAFVQLTLSISVLLFYHWSIPLVTLVLAVVMIRLPDIFRKQMRDSAQIISEGQEKYLSRLKDALSGFATMRIYGMTGQIKSEVSQFDEEFESTRVQFIKSQASCESKIGLINVLCQMGVNALIAVLSVVGLVPIGTIFGGGNIVGMVFNALNNISQGLIALSASKVFFEKFKVKAEEDKLQLPLELPRRSIEAENISFSYGESRILNKFSARFDIGGKYAIVGKSGCGKSTFLKILGGILSDYEGRLLFDGKDGKNMDYTPHMVYIEQDVYLFNKSIEENITLGSEISEETLKNVLRDSALESDFVEKNISLDMFVGENGNKLSGGEKQRWRLHEPWRTISQFYSLMRQLRHLIRKMRRSLRKNCLKIKTSL